nr:hypothetical transcript [Hymenolepis microstoma]
MLEQSIQVRRLLRCFFYPQQPHNLCCNPIIHVGYFHSVEGAVLNINHNLLTLIHYTLIVIIIVIMQTRMNHFDWPPTTLWCVPKANNLKNSDFADVKLDLCAISAHLSA